ncbi:MAG: type I secretion C-terminal target domain-containing protein, partial [Nitratireductor sp.]|nr:type I secretion C-terminal target domain-containing protein [Nitratireductor sp.]
EVISTESATGVEVSVPTATFTDTFQVTVSQVVDAPSITVVNAQEGAAGYEDTIIPLVVDVRLVDNDGSEALGNVVISGIPAGAQIVNGAGAPLGTITGVGEVTVTVAQLSQLHIIPPANSNDDFDLTITASSTELPQGLPGDGDTVIGTATLHVEVIGVADPANIAAVAVNGNEDQPIALGAAVAASLADVDGSETLYFVIAGLPAGVVPSAGTYIGGSWQVDAADMATLTVPAPANFSGDYVADYAPSLQISAITQENDGSQTSVSVPLTIIVDPVVDAQSWTPAIQVSEDNNISLANVAPPSLLDSDGSEQVEFYRFDFNAIIADAGIGATVASVADFIANHVNGTFNDNLDGTITVLPANLSGMSLDAGAFADSNRDFSIPVTVGFSDTGNSTVTASVAVTYGIDLVGVADIPTVFAGDYSGTTGTPVAVNPTGSEFGGMTTDADVSLGNPQSESIHYIVSNLDGTPGLNLAFVDATTGAPVGFNNNNGTWTLRPSDLVNLGVTAAPGSSGTVTLTLTTVATENDGDVSTNSATFDVAFGTGPGAGVIPTPLPPLVTVNPMSVNEDGTIALDIQVAKDPLDPSVPDPFITVVLNGIPADATVSGAFFNPINGTWVTDAATISAGGISVTPADDWSGVINITVDAIATNLFLQEASTNGVAAPVDVVPVADGPAISFSTSGGDEDSAIAVSIGVALTDTNGTVNEQIQEPIVITVSEFATLSAGIDIGGGVWHLTQAELAGLTVTPALNNGNDISIQIAATTIEPANSSIQTNTVSHVIAVSEVADAPLITTLDSSGNEDTAIALGGLSATLVDIDGSETLSVTISGVPDGAILSAGANNGDGSWTIPAAALATLSMTPPHNFSGVLSLTLNAYSLEANGATSIASSVFDVTVNPVADSAVITPLPQTGDEGEPIALNLNIQPGDINGSGIGENPAETVLMTLTGLGTQLVPTASGGSFTDNGGGSWTFTGTVAEANTVAIISDGLSGNHTVGVSVAMVDGIATGTSVTGNVVLTINPVADQVLTGSALGETLSGAGGNDTIDGLGGADLLNGGAGADTINGGAGADQITGGLGADTLTGGLDNDTFIWQGIDILSGATDTITDFNVGENDVLDLSNLLTAFNPGTDVITDFVNLSVSGADTVVQIDQSGSASFSVDVVTLQGVTGLDLATLYTNGNIAA